MIEIRFGMHLFFWGLGLFCGLFLCFFRYDLCSELLNTDLGWMAALTRGKVKADKSYADHIDRKVGANLNR